eukprot:8066204-Pyramimonas_sp.AAC.1
MSSDASAASFKSACTAAYCLALAPASPLPPRLGLGLRGRPARALPDPATVPPSSCNSICPTRSSKETLGALGT